MAQHNNVAAANPRYTRADFTALRFRLNRIPTAHILSRVYDEEALQAAGIETPAQLEAWLDAMRDHLVERVCLANPYLSESLADARRFNRWPKTAVDYLVRAADQDFSRPQPDDPVSAWLRPIVFRTLRQEQIQTLAQLHAYIALRGKHWYLPIPRLGVGKRARLSAGCRAMRPPLARSWSLTTHRKHRWSNWTRIALAVWCRWSR